MSPYNLLPKGRAIEIYHASSVLADKFSPSSQHELNALVMHNRHHHLKVIWNLQTLLLPLPKLLPQQHLQFCLLHHCLCQHYQQHKLHQRLLLHQLLHWDQDAPMPSWTLTISMLVLQPPSCTISFLEETFDGEADYLAVFLASICNQACHFNWYRLITMPIDDGTTRNLLTHYGQVSIENTRSHTTMYINSPTRDAQDNDMFYYFLADSLTNEFHTTVLLYADDYTITNIPVALSLLKQIIILTRIDNPASTMHVREMLIESKQKLLVLKGNITEFNNWVHKQIGRLHTREQEAVDLLYYLWKAYKAAPDDELVVYMKALKSQCNDGLATFTAEDLMVHAENKYEAQLLDEENAWGKPTEEQEKIVMMSAEINFLKKECHGTPNKTSKPKQTGKKQAIKKAAPKKLADKKKKAKDKWAWKIKPPRKPIPRRMAHSSKLSKTRSRFGASTTTMVLACGLSMI